MESETVSRGVATKPRVLLGKGLGYDYLARQAFFEPYPVELVEITDSGKGRDRRRVAI